MALAFADMATVVGDMLARTDLDTQVRRELGNVIESLNRRALFPLEFRAARLYATQGTIWYSVTSLNNGAGYLDRDSVSTQDVLRIQYMRRAGDSDPGMWFMEYSDFEQRIEGTTLEGTPTYYTLHNGQIGIWPAPSGDEIIEYSAWIKTEEFDDWGADDVTAASLPWLNEAREYMQVSAARRVAAYYLHDMELAGIYAADEGRLLGELVADSTRRQTRGHIKSHGL